MAQQYNRIQMPLIGFIVLCLLAGLSLLLWRRSMKPEPKPSITHHSVETSPDEVLNYWTPEKMQNTTTTNMPNVDTLEGTKPHPRRLPRLFRRGRNK